MDEKQEYIGKKISKLVHEGKPQKQAVAMAISMGKSKKSRAKYPAGMGKDMEKMHKEMHGK